MKKDVQVGVVLGVIILAIIGVFLSTKTSIKEPTLPVPELEDGGQAGKLNPDELQSEPSDVFKPVVEQVSKPTKPVEQDAANAAKIKTQLAEIDDSVLVGAWEKPKDKEPVRSTVNADKTTTTSGSSEWRGLDTPGKEPLSANARVHTVASNEDLFKIAKKYYGDGNKWLLIFNANQNRIHDRNSLKIGTELIIPDEQSAATASPKVVKAEEAGQTVKGSENTTKSNAKEHTVQEGDSLYKLAIKYYNDGTKWQAILDANVATLKKKKDLKVGQTLIIPDL
ncbi:MAG: LysM peptidoglycan-binding domain-containing protein [Planctomycetes bacterium]|nr:LysM peptidoglycan-binding domain-containing protein [Planctomycetota bacterium]